jgi:hypothetical protein
MDTVAWEPELLWFAIEEGCFVIVGIGLGLLLDRVL